MKIKAESADQLHRAYLITTLAVLTCATAIVATFGWIWTSDPARQMRFLPGLLLIGTTGIAATTALLVFRLFVHQASYPLSLHFRIWGVLSEGAFWGLVTIAGLCWFVAVYVLDVVGQPHEWRVATFWRAMSVTNGLSILVPLFLLLSSLYVWSTWNMRRLKMQTYGRCESAVFYDLLTGRDPAVRPKGRQSPSPFRRRLRWSMIEIAPWDRLRSWWWFAPVVLGVLLLLLARDRFTTVDGLAASRLLWWCSVCGLVLGADAVARSADQGAVLLEALRRLKSHPVSDAFARVASKPLDWRLRLSPLRRLALAPLIADMRILETRLGTVTAPALGAFEILKGSGSVSDWDAATPILATEQWPAVTRVVEIMYALLTSQQWTFAVRAQRGEGGQAWPVLDAAEDIVAYCTAFILRNLLARVIAGLSAGLTILGLVGFAHLFYSFQGRHFWLTMDLACFVLAALLACRILIRFERDQILSTLWAKTPGRINWTSGFIYRIAITAAIPTFLLMASFFPELAGSLTGMIEPLQKALP